MYVDSNVFVAAALGDETESAAARKILDKIQRGLLSAHTSVLTLDEVFWSVSRKAGRLAALSVFQALLESPINFVPATVQLMQSVAGILAETSLGPRDAIHLASAHTSKEFEIISNDSDFDKLVSVRRIGIEQAARA